MGKTTAMGKTAAKTAAALAVTLALCSATLCAQQPRLKAAAKPALPPAKDAASAKPAEPTPPPEPPPPAYEPKLLRLSEILGTLTYMRGLCGDGDGDDWRKRMAALMDAEGNTEVRKERLAGAFNRGFRGYQVTYRSCTAAARTIIGRALDEGERITREVASRYAG